MVQVSPLRASVSDSDLAVSYEARMEEGLAYESIPVASASICTTEPMHNDVAYATVTTLERSNSIPMMVASELFTSPALSSHQPEEGMERADFLSATICKGPKDENDVGLLLANTNGHVTIAGIEQDGMFKAAPFEIDDRVMSINNKSCDHMDAESAANLIKNAKNIVTVVVQAPNGRSDLVSSTVRKERPETLVGVTLKKHRGKVVISSIAEDGLFAHTLLNVGDTCLSINGIKITPNIDARASAELIVTSPDFVTLEAQIGRETGVVVAALEESRARVDSVQYGCIFFFFLYAIIVIIIVSKRVSERNDP